MIPSRFPALQIPRILISDPTRITKRNSKLATSGIFTCYFGTLQQQHEDFDSMVQQEYLIDLMGRLWHSSGFIFEVLRDDFSLS